VAAISADASIKHSFSQNGDNFSFIIIYLTQMRDQIGFMLYDPAVGMLGILPESLSVGRGPKHQDKHFHRTRAAPQKYGVMKDG
jgi:hypothetical protein